MAATVHRLSGEEWQSLADLLLARRYGPAQYQKIPAKDSGDAGIEGFSLCGHAYQAYGLIEPVTTRLRYEKQRDKITDDIGKFINNKSKLSSLLGTIVISRWCLFVPFFDSKELVGHAASKTAEVKLANLPYVTPDFRVMVCDEDEFAAERDALINSGVAKLRITAPTATQEHIDEWADENDSLVTTLDGKIGRLPTCTDKAKRKKFRDRLIKHFLEGQNILEGLRKYPTTYEKVVQVKNQRENFLATECMVATGSPADILQNALKAIREAVAHESIGVVDHTAEAMSWEAVADWMLRCPLDFPEVEAAAG
jgi:hypothetical protein